MTITIRLAKPADAEALPDIERDAGRIFLAIPDLAWIAGDTVTSVEEHLASIAGGAAWVAEDAATGLCGFLSAEVAGAELHIAETAVRRDFQQRGIGARMIEAAARHARATGLAAITLTTFRHVAWNAPFYACNGFEIVNDEHLDGRLTGLLREEAARGLPHRCAMRRRIS